MNTADVVHADDRSYDAQVDEAAAQLPAIDSLRRAAIELLVRDEPPLLAKKAS